MAYIKSKTRTRKYDFLIIPSRSKRFSYAMLAAMNPRMSPATLNRRCTSLILEGVITRASKGQFRKVD